MQECLALEYNRRKDELGADLEHEVVHSLCYALPLSVLSVCVAVTPAPGWLRPRSGTGFRGGSPAATRRWFTSARNSSRLDRISSLYDLALAFLRSSRAAWWAWRSSGGRGRGGRLGFASVLTHGGLDARSCARDVPCPAHAGRATPPGGLRVSRCPAPTASGPCRAAWSIPGAVPTGPDVRPPFEVNLVADPSSRSRAVDIWPHDDGPPPPMQLPSQPHGR